MKKKQWGAVILATVIFMITGVSSVLVNTWSKKQTAETTSFYQDLLAPWEEMDTVLMLPEEEYVAVIDVVGTIYSEAPITSFMESSEGYDHQSTMEYVDLLMEDENNKAILLYINSPGGEVTASDDLYLKLVEYKQETGRKIYCYFGNQACSGGYYVAMAADEIYANRNGWTGSIGVIIQTMDMTGLYDKLGIKDNSITSGPNKTIGSSTQPMTDEQRAILQGLVDEAYEQFVGIVAEGRNMELATVKRIGDGRIYTAKQALELQLIDGICTREEYEKRVQNEVGEDVWIYEREEETSFFDSLFATIDDIMPKSDAQVMENLMEQQKIGGLMYYAR